MTGFLGGFGVKRHSTPKAGLFSSSNYAYVTTRVKAKRAFLITGETYQRLLVMDVHEISRFIGESQYRKEIGELGLKYKGAELTELALNKNMSAVSHQILGYCKGELRAMVDAYLTRWDVWNIKTVIRGTMHGADTEEMMKSIVPAGRYPEQFWRTIVEECRTASQAAERLKTTPYGDILQPLMENDNAPLDKIENALQMEYYVHLLENIKPDSKANRLFLDFIRREIDLVNLKTLFMTKYENVEPERITSLMVRGGNIPWHDIEALVNSADFKQFTSELQRLSLGNLLKEEIPLIEKTASLTPVIRALDKDYTEKADQFSRLYPLSVLPILNFLIRKHIEVTNLRVLAIGKESGLDGETIRELLTIQD